MNDQAKQNPTMIEEARGMLMLITWTAWSSVLPLKLFSRVPGTVGAGVWLPSIFVGAVVMMVAPIFFLNMGHRSVLPFWFGQIGSYMLIIHLIAYYIAHVKGNGVHSHCVGASWFNYVKKTGNPDLTAAYGDSMVAGLLALIAFLCNDPPFALWWLLNIPLSFVAFAIVTERDKARGRRIVSDAVDIKYWENMVKRATDDGEDME